MRGLKCALLFFIAATVHGLGGEFVRAWAAARAGMPNTLYHFFILYDANIPAPEPGRVVLSVLAPLAFSVIVGLAAAGTYARARSASIRLFCLYLGTFGAIGVLGPLAFAMLPGNLQDIGTWLALPAVVVWSLAIASGLVLAVVLWEAGRRAQPPASALLLPVALGTAARLVAFLPVPLVVVVNLVGGSAYWLVTIAGSIWEQRISRRGTTTSLPPINLAYSTLSFTLLLVVVIRWMATGVRFGS
jgi:hypothetical protein